jgi:hypothetical protein
MTQVNAIHHSRGIFIVNSIHFSDTQHTAPALRAHGLIAS